MSFHRKLSDIDETILKRAAQEVLNGQTVNLGIGMPTMLPVFLPDDKQVLFHAENGFIGMGQPIEGGTPDHHVIDAGGRACELVNGAACFDSVTSFCLIRSGRLDLAILGAFEVGLNGDLANWIIPGKLTPGMGGGMELAQKAKRVIVVSHHADKKGRSKLKQECTLPLTAPKCVDMLITERAVFAKQDGVLTLTSIHPDYDQTSALDGIDFAVPVAKQLQEWTI